MLKNITIFTAILLVIGGLLFVQSANHSSSGKSKSGQPILKKLDTEKLTNILIQGEHTIELIKNADNLWKVKSLNYNADRKEIQTLLINLLKIKLGDLVTSNPKRHEVFHLLHIQENEGKWEPEKTGTLLKLINADGTSPLEFLMGKDRSQGEGQYVRFGGDPNIYLIAENLINNLNAEDWQDRVIVSIKEPKDIKSIASQRSSQNKIHLVREKAESDWQLEGKAGDESLNTSTINSVINALKDLEMVKLLPALTPPPELGRKQQIHLRIELFDGRIFSIDLGEQSFSDEKYYALTIKMMLRDGVTEEGLQTEVKHFNERSDPWIYVLSTYDGEQFLKGYSDFVGNK